MRITCTNCGLEFELPGEWSETIACPKCRAEIHLQSAATVKYSEPPKLSGPGDPETLSPGTLLGSYRIEKFIGRGGMGSVYRARHEMLQRTVALKVLPPKFGRDAEFVMRFRREAQALANLAHPYIVAVHDMGMQGEVYFFAMEFVDGVSLRDLMAGHKLDPATALKMVPLLCEALDYAHSQGIVHRDIKPENVLVDRTGRPKIADFGLVKILNGESVTPELTQTNVVLGTVDYMAPEQRSSTKQVDHRADIYSLGVMLYEMLTGELPVGRFDLPSKRLQIDVRIDDVVLKAIERDPERRYQRASHLATEMGKLMGPVGGRFDIGSCLSHALGVWRPNLLLLLAAGFVSGVITIFSLGFLAGPMAGGMALLYLDALRSPGHQVRFELLFSGFRRFWALVGLFYLSALIGLVGILLLVVPGLYWSIRLIYSYYLVVDRGFGPIDALKGSWRLTSSPLRARHFGLWFLETLFNTGPQGFTYFIPYVGGFLGSLITWIVGPIGRLMVAHAYSVVHTERAKLLEDLGT